MTAVVADTHTLIWYLCRPSKLSIKALNALDGATNSGDSIYISTISLVEIIYLGEKKRLPQEILTTINNSLSSNNFGLALADLNFNVVDKLKIIERKIVPDMPDRIIAATALSLDIPLVSCDSKIRNLSIITVIW